MCPFNNSAVCQCQGVPPVGVHALACRGQPEGCTPTGGHTPLQLRHNFCGWACVVMNTQRRPGGIRPSRRICGPTSKEMSGTCSLPLTISIFSLKLRASVTNRSCGHGLIETLRSPSTTSPWMPGGKVPLTRWISPSLSRNGLSRFWERLPGAKKDALPEQPAGRGVHYIGESIDKIVGQTLLV